MSRESAALSPEQAAKRLGVSARTVYRLVKTGALPAAWVGSQLRILPASLDALLQPRLCPTHASTTAAAAEFDARLERALAAGGEMEPALRALSMEDPAGYEASLRRRQRGGRD
ncbi:MAG: helix-turn-helix domain-containing protein [Armatimonadetes bacterium]|nr:helix-turn-helix domain-containing protein [Armatimonadota bacterium]